MKMAAGHNSEFKSRRAFLFHPMLTLIHSVRDEDLSGHELEVGFKLMLSWASSQSPMSDRLERGMHHDAAAFAKPEPGEIPGEVRSAGGVHRCRFPKVVDPFMTGSPGAA